MFGDAVAAMGGLDVLVNNAGITGPTAKVEDVSVQGGFRTQGWLRLCDLRTKRDLGTSMTQCFNCYGNLNHRPELGPLFGPTMNKCNNMPGRVGPDAAGLPARSVLLRAPCGSAAGGGRRWFD